ncbi:hypothetical protein LTS18_003156 [Coniosporium uncinatum]|uniref:Uncharacterized protein n=1 Tax=Coniosporium uncinatum TaxID=93489 RepID=A0ACC3DCX4_9PEZI|nr:hypothetical protein LTS18_003156 [Coniosporium uncinatum]
MRFSLLCLLVSLPSSFRGLAAADPAPPPAVAPTPSPEPEAEDAWTIPHPAVFNGQDVPPITFFSPYCGHCKAFAPTFQTFYEFYYTSDPLPTQKKESQKPEGDHLNSFTRYYDFKFAKVDCVANGDACAKAEVHSFPTVVIFKDGKEVKRSVGNKRMSVLSEFMEETLETIKPGSRPKEGLALPEVGAKSVDPSVKPTEPESKDKNPAAGASAASKHNEVASAAATETASATVEVSTKPTSTANPDGKSVDLNQESFQQLVTKSMEPWFIKFYAPWCHHCQAMAPNWKEMALEMKGKLNIGEANCDIEKKLCKDARVQAYPTLQFFRAGERAEYSGLRNVGDLISYAKKAVELGTGVPDVTSEQFEKMEEAEEVIFIYFYDHATTSEDFVALERLTLSLIGHAKMIKTKDPKLVERFKISTWPRLVVSRDGKPAYYEHLAPKEMRDTRMMLQWMKTVWTPLVPELTASNAQEVMNGKLVVLAVLSRDRADEFVMARRELKSAALEWLDKEEQKFHLERQELRDAKQLRIEEAEHRNDEKAINSAKEIKINMDKIARKPVGFAWVDGVFWERWIRTTYGIDVKEGEKVVINDEANRRYWDTTITGNHIMPSRTSILETLPKVISSKPQISPKYTSSAPLRTLVYIGHFWSAHPFITLSGLVVAVIAFGYWWRNQLRRAGRSGSGNYFQLDGEKGLLGSNGKAD